MHSDKSNSSFTEPRRASSAQHHASSGEEGPSDEQLTALLQALPREEASLGFEERVLRRVREAPTPPLTLARGLRLAAPLVMAAVLGFVLGPSLLERGDRKDSSAASEVASVAPGSSGTASARRPIQALPVAGGQVAGAQVAGSQVAGRGPQMSRQTTSPQVTRSSSLAQIRAEAARVRRELDALRSAQAAAGPTVTVTMADGVEVQVDIHELVAVLEERAAEIAAQAPPPDIDRDSSSSTEPPVW